MSGRLPKHVVEMPGHLPWTAIAGDVAEPMPQEIAALGNGGAPVWIFAYGSLMWNPEIACAEARPALLHGYRRSFCLYSYDYRGSRERPGLVLGLDRGGACWGMALRLEAGALAVSLERIWVREMSGGVYRMRRVTVRAVGLQPTDPGSKSCPRAGGGPGQSSGLVPTVRWCKARGLIRGGAALPAHAFVVRRDHPDYAGSLPLDDQARLILAASGRRGNCRDYFATTLGHLERLGLVDRPLRRLAERVAALEQGQ